jgi:hypothetical protein
MGIFFRDPQLDRIETVADRIDTNTRNLLAAAARIEKTQEANMSKTDDALGRLATAVVSAVTQLQQSRTEAQASKATADAVVANDAAEDAAQLDAQDTSAATAIDSAVAILVEALKDPEVLRVQSFGYPTWSGHLWCEGDDGGHERCGSWWIGDDHRNDCVRGVR